jgi:hypothetical protein
MLTAQDELRSVEDIERLSKKRESDERASKRVTQHEVVGLFKLPSYAVRNGRKTAF